MHVVFFLLLRHTLKLRKNKILQLFSAASRGRDTLHLVINTLFSKQI